LASLFLVMYDQWFDTIKKTSCVKQEVLFISKDS
jgi:hypothetical protein